MTTENILEEFNPLSKFKTLGEDEQREWEKQLLIFREELRKEQAEYYDKLRRRRLKKQLLARTCFLS